MSSTAHAPRVASASRPSYLEILDEAWQQHLAPREAGAPTVISTFAGCGGSSLGYSMAGYRELLAVEWDQNAVDTFRLNFPDVPIWHGDIAKLSVDECLERAGVQPGELDVLDGSPPCQGFSTAGKREMADPRNQLFREYVRLLRGLQPKVLVMENVSGMVKGKMKLIFADILRELKASSYVVSARLMNAMYFNVPQSRQRMIFVGVREDVGIVPSHPKGENRPMIVSDLYPNVSAIRSYGAGYAIKWLTPQRPHPTIGRDHAQKPTRWRIGGIEHRPTTRELATISSFPTAFQWLGTPNEQWERIGNSVPPLFLRSIAAHIRTQILESPHEAIVTP